MMLVQPNAHAPGSSARVTATAGMNVSPKNHGNSNGVSAPPTTSMSAMTIATRTNERRATRQGASVWNSAGNSTVATDTGTMVATSKTWAPME